MKKKKRIAAMEYRCAALEERVKKLETMLGAAVLSSCRSQYKPPRLESRLPQVLSITTQEVRS